jgi:hypothetical protein
VIGPGGTPIVGTGSEWFWAALQFVVVTITLVAIYRQVRAERESTELAQFERLLATWNDETFLRARLAVLVNLRNPPTRDLDADMWRIAGFFDDLAIQRRGGRLRAQLVWEFFGPDIQFWWPALRDALRQDSVSRGEPRAWSRFEELHDQTMKQQAHLGVMKADHASAAAIAAEREANIEFAIAHLRHLRDAREGRVPEVPAARRVADGH